MAADQWTDLARRAGEHLAATLSAHPVVQTLWATADDEGLELWLVTAPTEGAVELQLLAAVTPQLRQFHDAAVRLRILNRRNYPAFNPDVTLPDGAVLVTRFAGAG
jgi:hypothetical protein